MKESIGALVTKENIIRTLSSFKKENIPSPNGWNIEFYLEFFGLLVDHLVSH